MRKAAAFLLLVCLTVFFSASAEEAGSFDLPGSIVRFGHFEQDNNLENGPEEIEWMVLDTVDGQSLLLSLYALDTRPFNETYGDITWEECTLRAWLNGAFYEDAFSETEKQAVVLNHTDNGPDSCCSKYGIPGGNDTDDHVFLLSYTQAATYFTVSPVSARPPRMRSPAARTMSAMPAASAACGGSAPPAMSVTVSPAPTQAARSTIPMPAKRLPPCDRSSSSIRHA